MGAYDVHADTIKNRLYITLRGFLTDSQARAAADAVIAEVEKLNPGFDAITDISTFQPVSVQATAEVARAQQIVKACGVRRVVRIQRLPTLGSLQLQRKSREAGYGGTIAYSLEEAERILDRA